MIQRKFRVMGQEEDKDLHYTLSDMVDTRMYKQDLDLVHQGCRLVKALQLNNILVHLVQNKLYPLNSHHNKNILQEV
jgi:hypothetical protein